MNPLNITPGHLARHTPRGAGAQGRDAALVDIAQDLLLRDLHRQGLLDDLAFKGGTVLDVSPPPWLTPQRRGWVPMPVHTAYGDPPLPHLQVVRLEENLAEKIARLNRTTPARDMYDLRWVNHTYVRAGHLDTALIRRLAVLKIWVDDHGLIGATNHGQTE